MEKLMSGRTCFIIAHRLSTVRNSDMLVIFNEGEVEAVGTHEELWVESPTYRKLHGIHLTERTRDRIEAKSDRASELLALAS